MTDLTKHLEKECQDWHELYMLSQELVKRLEDERRRLRATLAHTLPLVHGRHRAKICVICEEAELLIGDPNGDKA